MNRDNYETAKQEAATRGLSLAALIEAGLAAIGVPMVAHTQQSPELVRSIAARKAASADARTNNKLPSRERQLLGDQAADTFGFS